MKQPVLPEVVEEDTVTITDEEAGALTPEGNLTLVDDYYTNYSDGSGQQFIKQSFYRCFLGSLRWSHLPQHPQCFQA